MPNEPGAPRRDRAGVVFALGFVTLGAAMLWGARGMTPLGAVFPTTIGVAMMALGAVLLIAAWLGRTRPPPPPASAESTPRRVGLAVVMGLWALAIPVVGFFATSAVAFAGLVLIANHHGWSRRRLVAYGAAGLVLLVGFYVLFVELLNVPTPRGLLI